MKITASHLRRDAYLYIRQSTLRQVFENQESTQRQYALRERAVALGWPIERVHVIDSDLGKSGASAADREGFKRLVAEVSMGSAGIVLGLEVSRLARNCTDWHRLLEICALSDTLILDEDGLYNPSDFNDRLLLGLKGTMSEAELHMLRARLHGGILNKARRGELVCPLPVGLVYDEQWRVKLDPDQQVRETLALFFSTFQRTGTALGVVKHFRKQQILFPRRLLRGPNKGSLLWGELVHSQALRLLHSPRYAGVFCYGRKRMCKLPDGKIHYKELPREEWYAFIPNAHEGYISLEEYEDNQRRLKENARAHGNDRRKSLPREGPALLQGIVLCGLCGRRMTVRYHMQRGRICPYYMCQRDAIEHGHRFCQAIPGAAIDDTIGDLLLEMMTPLTLDVALSVQQELLARLEEADRLRAKQVERVRYEAELAKQRFMQVDPNNRLVADALEAEWNEKLRSLTEAQEEYEQKKKEDGLLIDKEVRTRVTALATDFPRLWRDPKTLDRDRKRMVRLLLEDVTLIKKKGITLHIRFKGGLCTTRTLPAPARSWEIRQTPSKVVKEIDRLLDDHTDGQIAALLNTKGFRSGEGLSFSSRIVSKIRCGYDLKSHYNRMREAGMLTVKEMAKKLGVHTCTIKTWRREGLLRGYPFNDKEEYLFMPPGPDAPVKSQGQKLSERRRFTKVVSDRSKEVQYEA